MKNTCDTVLGAMLGGRQLGLAFAITSICSLESGSALLSLAQSGHRATHCTIVDPKVNVEQRLFWLDRFMSDSNCGGSRGDERDRSSLTLEKTMEGMVAAVKEAGDAALALQVPCCTTGVGKNRNDYCASCSLPSSESTHMDPP